MSSSAPRRSNSTNPRPGSSAFPPPSRRPSDAVPLRRPSDAQPPRRLPSDAIPLRRPSADTPLRSNTTSTNPARITLRPSSSRPTPQQSAPERTFPVNTSTNPRDSLRPAPLRTRNQQQQQQTSQRPTPQQTAPTRTFPTPQSTQQQSRTKRSFIFQSRNTTGNARNSTSAGAGMRARKTPQQSAPQRSFPPRQGRNARAPIPPRQGGGGGTGGDNKAGSSGATKNQINQTYAITLMASPYNPALPFFLGVPLGVGMLLVGGSGGKRGDGNG